jgi:hypothetical protein
LSKKKKLPKTIEVDLGDQILRFNQEAIDAEIIKAARLRLPIAGTPSRIALDLNKSQAPPKNESV